VRVRLLVAAAAGLGGPALLGPLPGLAAGAVVAGVAWHVTGRMESPAARRRRERLVAQLPHVVDLMAACLAVGLAPPSAARRVVDAVGGPAAEELERVLARLDLGVDPATAWRDLGRHAQLGPLGRCLARSVESGASVSEAMHRLAEDLRRNARAAVESRVRTVGVRAAVPLGVCLLPAFLLLGVLPLVAGTLPLVLGR
jgi:Flp pilus assembly protein TadB